MIVQPLTSKTFLEVVNDTSLRDIDDGGLPIKETVDVASQGLIVLMFDLGRVHLVTWPLHRLGEVVGKHHLEILHELMDSARRDCSHEVV